MKKQTEMGELLKFTTQKWQKFENQKKPKYDNQQKQ